MHENDYQTAHHKCKSQWSENSSKKVDYEVSKLKEKETISKKKLHQLLL